MERVKSSDVTDALIRATESVGKFNKVIIIFDGDGDIMQCHDNDLSHEQMIAMLERTKMWVLGLYNND